MFARSTTASVDWTDIDSLGLVCTPGAVLVDGPYPLEPDEALVPVENAEELRYGYLLSGTGGIRMEDLDATAVALARAADGVVASPTEVRWPVQGTRDVPGSTTVDVLHVAWYGRDLPNVSPLLAFCRAAESTLPAALPRRYGDDDYMRHEMGEAGWTAIERLRIDARHDDIQFMCRALPAVEGTVSSVRTVLDNPRNDWLLRVGLVADGFEEPAEVERLRTLFIAVGEATSADYAKIELTRGIGLSIGRFASVGTQSSPQRQWGHAGFLGLPQQPVWWSWFGPGYVRHLHSRLESPPQGWQVSATDSGYFVGTRDAPATARELRPRGIGRSLTGGWVPQELRVRGNPDGDFVGPRRAKVLP